MLRAGACWGAAPHASCPPAPPPCTSIHHGRPSPYSADRARRASHAGAGTSGGVQGAARRSRRAGRHLGSPQAEEPLWDEEGGSSSSSSINGSSSAAGWAAEVPGELSEGYVHAWAGAEGDAAEEGEAQEQELRGLIEVLQRDYPWLYTAKAVRTLGGVQQRNRLAQLVRGWAVCGCPPARGGKSLSAAGRCFFGGGSLGACGHTCAQAHEREHTNAHTPCCTAALLCVQPNAAALRHAHPGRLRHLVARGPPPAPGQQHPPAH